jgi:hypothetical protein
LHKCKGGSPLLDSVDSGSCPSLCLNVRGIFLEEKLWAREKQEKGKAICKCLWGEGVRLSLFFPSFGKSISPFPFFPYSCSQGRAARKHQQGMRNTTRKTKKAKTE